MGDTLRPYMFVLLPHPPPPPPPPPSKGTDMPMLYYGLVVVGTAAIVLAIYNLLLLRWCTDYTSRRGIENQQNPAPRLLGGSSSSSSRSLDDINSITSTFKYKKEGVGPPERDQGREYECVVCLSLFEEGEELRQLPSCKHSFHAPCIDMWLYSHLDCPLCRSRVEPPVLRRSPPAVAVPVSGPAMQTGLERPHRASALAEVYLY